jgi:hypothetical protein
MTIKYYTSSKEVEVTTTRNARSIVCCYYPHRREMPAVVASSIPVALNTMEIVVNLDGIFAREKCSSGTTVVSIYIYFLQFPTSDLGKSCLPYLSLKRRRGFECELLIYVIFYKARPRSEEIRNSNFTKNGV